VDVSDVVPWVLSRGMQIERIEPKVLRDDVVRAAKKIARMT
jgi:hypothetical protein